MSPRIACFLLLGICSTLGAGCARYQFGTRSLYRPDIRTIYVPMFQSDSLRQDLSERLTEAVVKEIEVRTPYKVVSDPSADSVLTGRILEDRKVVVAENQFDEPRDIEAQMIAQVSWVDRRGMLIMQNINLPLSPFNLAFEQSEHFVPEAGQSLATAHQEVIEELAEQIVSQMEIPW